MMVFCPLIDEQEEKVDGRGVLLKLPMERIKPCHREKVLKKVNSITFHRDRR